MKFNYRRKVRRATKKLILKIREGERKNKKYSRAARKDFKYVYRSNSNVYK